MPSTPRNDAKLIAHLQKPLEERLHGLVDRRGPSPTESKGMGVGIDVEPIDRFRSLPLRDPPDPRVRQFLTAEELQYCRGKMDPAQHVAGRFVAKEATLKALASLGFEIRELTTIKIRSDGRPPQVHLSTSWADAVQVELSITHAPRTAAAQAIAVEEEEP